MAVLQAASGVKYVALLVAVSLMVNHARGGDVPPHAPDAPFRTDVPPVVAVMGGSGATGATARAGVATGIGTAYDTRIGIVELRRLLPSGATGATGSA
jgi:hypothetical protein